MAQLQQGGTAAAERLGGLGGRRPEGEQRTLAELSDEEKAEADAEKMLKGRFNMGDFLEQIKTIQKMGSLKDLVEKLPFFKDGLPEGVNVDDKELVKIESMINSMTKSERANPELFVVTSFEEIKDRIENPGDDLISFLLGAEIDGKPGLLIGDDLLAGFATWKNAAELARRVEIIVFHRMRSFSSTSSAR